VIRALEVYEATGRPISAQQSTRPSPYASLEIELHLGRDELYRRIDARVDAMIAAGLIEELRALLDAGVPADAPAMSAIGYRQLVPVVRDGTDHDEAIQRIKFDTHRLVRSQQTWFRRNTRKVTVDASDPAVFERIADLIERHAGAWLRARPGERNGGKAEDLNP
jgi:tRNA dimethylallyltransferase